MKVWNLGVVVVCLFVGLSSCEGATRPIQNSFAQANCQVAGPSLENTIAYLNKAMRDGIANGDEPGNLEIALGERLNEINIFEGTGVDRDKKVYRVDMLSCSPNVDLERRSASYFAEVRCVHNLTCGRTYTLHRDGWSPQAGHESLAIGRFDEMKAQHVSRAISHLVYLVQQRYQRSRSDLNDGFGENR